MNEKLIERAKRCTKQEISMIAVHPIYDLWYEASDMPDSFYWDSLTTSQWYSDDQITIKEDEEGRIVVTRMVPRGALLYEDGLGNKRYAKVDMYDVRRFS